MDRECEAHGAARDLSSSVGDAPWLARRTLHATAVDGRFVKADVSGATDLSVCETAVQVEHGLELAASFIASAFIFVRLGDDQASVKALCTALESRVELIECEDAGSGRDGQGDEWRRRRIIQRKPQAKALLAPVHRNRA